MTHNALLGIPNKPRTRIGYEPGALCALGAHRTIVYNDEEIFYSISFDKNRNAEAPRIRRFSLSHGLKARFIRRKPISAAHYTHNYLGSRSPSNKNEHLIRKKILLFSFSKCADFQAKWKRINDELNGRNEPSGCGLYEAIGRERYSESALRHKAKENLSGKWHKIQLRSSCSRDFSTWKSVVLMRIARPRQTAHSTECGKRRRGTSWGIHWSAHSLTKRLPPPPPNSTTSSGLTFYGPGCCAITVRSPSNSQLPTLTHC